MGGKHMKKLSDLSLSSISEIKEDMSSELYWKRDELDEGELRLHSMLLYVEAVENHLGSKYYGVRQELLDRAERRAKSIADFYDSAFITNGIESEIFAYLEGKDVWYEDL